MSFAAQIRTAKGDLTARQVATAVSPLLSVRTVEKWLAGDNEPPAWTHDWIFSRVRNPKKARSRKGQNDEMRDGERKTSANTTDAL